MATRICTQCKQEFELSHFYRNKRAKDGCHSQCKNCMAAKAHAWWIANSERAREKAHKWRVANTEKACETRRKYRAANREKLADYNRKWRTANSKRANNYNREWRAANRQKARETNRKWRAANPESSRKAEHKWKIAHPEKARETRRITNHNRRRQARIAGGRITVVDVALQMKRQRKCCYYCKDKLNDKYHLDHVVPLSRGGPNEMSNVVIACPSCNSSKQDKLPHEWPKGGRLL